MKPSTVAVLVSAALVGLLGLSAASVSAQSAPSRRDFVTTFRPRVELVTHARSSPSDYDEGEPRTVEIAADLRFQVASRIRPIGGNQYAAILLVATSHGDVNGDPRYHACVAIIRRGDEGWESRALIPIDLFDGGFSYYDNRPVRIFRTEDVDDDGEDELLVAFATNTEMQGGIGACMRRQTALIDISSAELLFNTPTRLDCEGGYGAFERGTVRFIDRNNDGHRDVVRRHQSCAIEYNPDETRTCERAIDSVRLYREADDSYEAAPAP